MAKKEEKQKIVVVDKVVQTDISSELEQSYLSYAMSVIVGRAIPDIRDGLKPVQRRIIFGMFDAGNIHSKPTVKCARIVGNVMGNYHPHGDASIYDALVRMAQPFSMLVPLIVPQGNFGSIDGDNPAAMRYTEAKLAPITEKMTEDLIKDVTVNFIDNFDGSLKEPSFLPARFPNLLINGASGIAVGMSTNIMPHNLTEVMNAVIEAINVGDNFTYEDIAKHIKGPDFPTGGIISGEDGIKKYMKTGIGKVIIRAKYHIENEKSRQAIIIDEIPYTVNKSNLIEKIAELASAGKIVGISELRDESDKTGIRIYIGLKKDVNPDLIISYLYKNTQMEVSRNVQNLALTHNGLKPEILNIRDLIAHFIQMREIIIRKRTEYELKKKEETLEDLITDKMVNQDPDKAIKIIRSSIDRQDALNNLKVAYNINDRQSERIYNKRLGTFNKGDVKKNEEDIKATEQEIKRLKKILSDRKEILEIIKQESLEIIQKFGQPRKSIIDFSKKQIDHDQLVEQMQQADSQLLISQSWRVKRFDLDDFTEKVLKDDANRDLSGLFDEPIRINQEVTSENSIIVFMKSGTVFNVNPTAIPIQTNFRAKKDTNIVEYIKKEENDEIADMVIVENDIFNEEKPAGQLPKYFLFITAKGLIKKTDVMEFKTIRSNGLKAIDIKEGDRLIYAKLCDDCTEVSLKSANGKATACDLETIKTSSRTAKGQKIIRMDEEDNITEITLKQLIKQINLNSIEAKTEIEEAASPKSSVEAPSSVETPKVPVEASKGSVETPKVPVEASKGSVETPKVPVEAPKGSVEAPKGSVEAPKGSVEAPKGSVEAPKAPVEAPKGSVEAPKASVEAPKGSVEAPKAPVEAPKPQSEAQLKFLESLKPKAKIEPKKEPQETTKILKDEPKEKGSVKKETKQSEKKTIPSEKHAVKSTGEKTQITLDISSSNIKEDAKMVKKTSSQPETKKISEQKSPDTVKIEKPAKIEKPTKIEKPVVDDPLSDAKIISVLTETPATFMEIGKSMKLANPQQYQALKLKLTTLAMRKQIEEIMESGTKKYKKR